MKLFGKELKFNGYDIYHKGNKPTPSDIGAASASHSHDIVGYYGSDSADTNGWYKVCTVSQSGYSDVVLNLLITQGYSRMATGLLHLHTRCDNGTAITVKLLKWMYRYGFSAGDVKVVTGTNTWSLYVQQTVSRYGRIQVRVLSKQGTSGDTSFALSNNTTKESSAPGGTAATDGATVEYANSAGKAAKDGAGRQIDTTYYTKTEVDNLINTAQGTKVYTSSTQPPGTIASGSVWL